MGRKIHLSLAAALAVAALSPANASERIKLLAPALLELGQRFERVGELANATKIYRTLLEDADAEVRSEARFRLAKILAAEGKTTEAAVLMRRVADENPKATAPRIELVGLLHRIGDEAGVLRELRSLSRLDLPLNIARLVDRLSASLKSSQPLALQIELAVAPDTNINRATRSDTLGTVFGEFAFDEDSRAKSGVGLSARGLLQSRVDVSGEVSIAAHGSLDADLYRRSEFNDISFEAAVGPEIGRGPARIAIEVAFNQRWFGMKPYQRTFRASGSGRLIVDRASQLRVDASIRTSDNFFNDLQDGHGIGTVVRYERAFSARVIASLRGSFDRFKANEPAYATRSWSIGATISRDLGRATVDIGADYARLNADARLLILPKAREDKLARFQLGAVFRQISIAGFSPTIRIVRERNHSSVEYYEYKRTRTEFGISRSF
ncbi:hypothetical protein GCM10023264_18900 [Sphingomonas daechungensis]|uniref:DUF560 domain-containing protein n=1 Tax=Sphingomonas daechungensis TaxID=1176646 RepID=A0ABX6T8F6_9SPHN|nr:surface lipoprotein assembly modifier [Sphingomonas daechungensis]QNP43953.1 DUF560 domain-containing protein [Sphingomonas daechungensis]